MCRGTRNKRQPTSDNVVNPAGANKILQVTSSLTSCNKWRLVQNTKAARKYRGSYIVGNEVIVWTPVGHFTTRELSRSKVRKNSFTVPQSDTVGVSITMTEQVANLLVECIMGRAMQCRQDETHVLRNADRRVGCDHTGSWASQDHA